MALVPILLRDLFDDYLEDNHRPARFLSKRSARSDLFPEDILLALEDALPRRCRRKRCWRQSSSSEDNRDEIVAKKVADEFKVNINVDEYKPDEISVKATGEFVTVEGKHEDKNDENGYVLRHFIRRYQLPEGYDSEKIASTLSSDGVLTITAPKLALPEPQKERAIPVEKVSKSKELSDKPHSNIEQAATLEDLEE
ncbi:protein lethal(2)essential for life-like [Aedes albopictus]|uniref:SHSP domain-containing protein n=1 Tax=Aedes albopictus TaxID=7160 RepID=A0ABM1ZEI8_AEDAL|nr:protein lethal(2)essential for life-like [Aedes albopictus]